LPAQALAKEREIQEVQKQGDWARFAELLSDDLVAIDEDGIRSKTEPHIDPKALETITVPTLILAGDHDMIRDEHTLEIYHHLPNAELCIFPGATHAIPYDDPVLFSTTVDHFFQTPFVKKDRLNDIFRSLWTLWEKPNNQPRGILTENSHLGACPPRHCR